MWIPKPLYDHAPLFWFLLGVLFLSGGLYLEFGQGLTVAYFVFAFFCIGLSAWTFISRLRYRRHAAQQTSEESADPVES